MKALFLTSTFYESPFKLGDHHLAEQFAMDGWQVAYIAAPITPFHILGSSTDIIHARYDNYRSGGKTVQVGSGEIWSYVPGALASPKNKPLLNNDFIYKQWIKLTVPSLEKMLSRHGFAEVDLIYFSSQYFYPLLNSLPHQQSVFRIADQEAGYVHYTKHDLKRRAALARNVNLVIYTAKSMEDEVKHLQPRRAMHLSNGVQLDHFLDVIPDRPEEYNGILKPIVIYVGAMRYWFDSDLVNQMTEALPDVNFVLIGPDKEIRSRLEARDNLYILGKKKYEDLPKFLFHADLGIIPFNRSNYPSLVNSINPLKLYEYAACGLAIVATRWDELEKINPPAELCDTPQNFISAVRNALNRPVDRNAQITFAKQYSWRTQYDKLILTLSDIQDQST